LNNDINSIKKTKWVRKTLSITSFNICSNLATPRLWTI
jgi:hypothetical protein